MAVSPLLDELARALRAMPGIGQKLAERLALSMVQEQRGQAEQLNQTLARALAEIRPCQRCQMITQGELCAICADPERDQRMLVVVESVNDVQAIESAGVLYCRYFVLGGHLSMVDGIGPDELGVPALLALVEDEQTEEVVLATSPSPEGEATAAYLVDQLGRQGIRASKLARGIPNGASLAGVDSATLANALSARQGWQ